MMNSTHLYALALVTALIFSACTYDSDLRTIECDTEADCPGDARECIDGYCLTVEGEPNNSDPNNTEPNNSDPNNSEPNNAAEPCDDDLLYCDDACIDPTENLDHCGSCNNPCDQDIPEGAHPVCSTNPDDPSQASCSYSCNEGLSACGDLCVDTTTDPQFCGSCDNSCTDAESCNDGQCVDDCDDGFNACGDLCVDLENDIQHCGSCDNDCGDDSWPADSSPTCLDGECDFTCNDGFQRCGDACIDDDEFCCLPDDAPFGGGSGTPDDPHTLCHADHLQALGGTAAVDDHFVLTADIDWSDASSDLFEAIGTPDEPYAAHFDGQGYAISNITIELPDEDAVGFFRAIGPSGTVTDLVLNDLRVSGRHDVGGLVGSNHGEVSFVRTEGDLIDGAFRIGGVVGFNYGELTDAHSAIITVEAAGFSDQTNDLSDFADAGGLAGGNSGHLERVSSYSDATSISKGTAGGLVAYNAGTIADALSFGEVTADNANGPDNAGGLVGYCDLMDSSLDATYQITNAYSLSPINADGDAVGALIGQRLEDPDSDDLTPQFSNLYFSGQVFSDAVGAGSDQGTTSRPVPQFSDADTFQGFQFGPDGPWTIGPGPDDDDVPLLQHLID